MSKPRLVIADDYQPFLQELCSLLLPKFDIVATADCGRSALEAIRHCQPDMAVLDLSMPRLSGIQVLQQLATDLQRPKVVICSVETDPDVVAAAQKAGAAAFVTKWRFEKELIPALNSIIRRQVHL